MLYSNPPGSSAKFRFIPSLCSEGSSRWSQDPGVIQAELKNVNDSPTCQELGSQTQWIWGWEMGGGDMWALFTLANKYLLLLIETLGQNKCFQGHSSDSQAENRDDLHCNHLQKLLMNVFIRGGNRQTTPGKLHFRNSFLISCIELLKK